MANARKRVLLFEKETTYGTDPTPLASANAILTSGLTLDNPYGGAVVSRNLDREYLGGDQQINTGPEVDFSFGVEVAGSGTAGNEPNYSPLLEACGFGAATIVASTSAAYDLVSSSLSSGTAYFNIDGQQHIITGCRGNMSLELARGALPMYQFNFKGLYNAPTAVALPTPTVSGFQTPLPVTNANTPTATFASYDLIMQSLSIDLSNSIEYRNLVNQSSALGEVVITERAVRGTLVVEAPTLAAHNFFTDVRSDNGVVTGALEIVHGTTAGNIVELDAPAMQIVGIKESNSQGILMYSLDFVLVPSSGNDEFTITVR